MKLRVIVQTADYGAAANIGGPANITCRTFDVEAPAQMAEHIKGGLGDVPNSYKYRQIIGVEVLESEADASPKEPRDPIAAAVESELRPLADALIEAGHKLAKEPASGWQCVECGTFVVGTSIDLEAVVCGCGRGKGCWGVALASDEVKSSGKKESA